MMRGDASGSHFQPSAQHQHLIPVISSNTLRYNRSSSIQPHYQSIDAGPAQHCRNGIPSVSKWRRLIHPEGQPYFVLTGEFEFEVVTAANIEDVHTEGQIIDFAKLASSELQYHGIRVPLRCELVLELEDDYISCNYYFVDHVTKRLFWLTDVQTESLGIPPAKSLSHLEPMLQAYYWVYVEYFPMHHESRQEGYIQFVEDLFNIISHGRADRLTSRTSTFPYTADMCQQFLELLSRKRGQCIDGYTLCYVARIAGPIMNQRFNTYYGQEFAQLDRQQYLTDSSEHQWLWTVVNLLMWRIPWYYNNLLEDIYANGSVSDQWIHFLSLCIADWTNSLLWSLPVLIAGILLATMGGAISAAVPSVLSSAMSISSASFLHLWHQSFVEASPADGIYYIRLAKSRTVGFLLLSFVFSLPKASYLWGVLLLIVQFLLVAYHKAIGLVVAVAVLVIILILGLVWRVIFPEEPYVMSLLRSFISLFIPRLYSADTDEEALMV